jgi:predicted small metal-binding protein
MSSDLKRGDVVRLGTSRTEMVILVCDDLLAACAWHTDDAQAQLAVYPCACLFSVDADEEEEEANNGAEQD